MIIDLTGIAVSLVGVFGSAMSVVITAVINARMKDKQAAATLAAAVANSLGAMQQAATNAVLTTRPLISLPGVPTSLQVPVQYVLDHAGPELARFKGLTPQLVAEKVSAQIGLTSIAANLAVAASPAPIIPNPLGAVPVRVDANGGAPRPA